MIATLTPIEKLATNPHQLEAGDQVLLPDGSIDIIYRAGFVWAKFQDRQPIKLAELRPYNPGDECTPSRQQLTLF